MFGKAVLGAVLLACGSWRVAEAQKPTNFALEGKIPAVVPPGHVFTSMYYDLTEGSTFKVKYQGEHELRALAYPPEAVAYHANNTPNCFEFDRLAMKSMGIGAVMLLGTTHHCDVQPYVNTTIRSNVRVSSKKHVIWMLVNPTTTPVNITLWQIMPVVPWHMPAYAVILLIFFCFVIVASIVHFFLWRRNKKRAAAQDGIQMEIVTEENPQPAQ